jgi:cytochrome oxidase Cu insertion factor (SCO1/SenC/PrrC family)
MRWFVLRSRMALWKLALVCAWAAPVAAQNLYRLDLPFRDEQGRTVRLSEWLGRDAIVTMEYSNCAFMCSVTLYKLRQTQTAADERQRSIDFIVLGLDPRRDTQAAWAQYRQQRDLNRANWHFLTPSEADLPALARMLGIKYWYDGPHLLHDFRLLRTDTTGAIVGAVGNYDTDVNRLLD